MFITELQLVPADSNLVIYPSLFRNQKPFSLNLPSVSYLLLATSNSRYFEFSLFLRVQNSGVELSIC